MGEAKGYRYLNYDIHGIVRIRTHMDLNLPRMFMVRKGKSKPDLIVETITSFDELKIKNLSRIGRRYYGMKDGGFVFDILPVFDGRIGVSLKDVRGKTTVLGVTPLYRKLIKLAIGFYVLPISVHWQALLDIKLLQKGKGYTLVHAGGLKVNQDRGILFTGIGGAGKTLAVFSSLLISEKSGYLSNDIVITDGRKAYCFPSPAINGFLDKLISKLQRSLISTPKYDEPSVNEFQSFHIEKSADIKEIFFLESGTGKITELAKNEATEKILIAKRGGVGSYMDNSLFMAYRYFNPRENFEEFEIREKTTIQNLIEHADVFRLSYRSPKELAVLLKKIL